jgi:hypothetical protein
VRPSFLLTWDGFPSFVAGIDALIGDRFLGMKYPSPPTCEPLRLIQNWKSLLQQ